MTDLQLDLRALIPMERHKKVFRTFEDLSVGGKFVLLTDHDPKPLFHQFKSKYSDAFGWEYLEKGPMVWKIQVQKTDLGGSAGSTRGEGCCGICGGH